jgi:uncharacterized membrane protein YfcA
MSMGLLLASCLVVGIFIGVVAGVKLAHVAGAKQLRCGASVLCILSAVGMVVKSMTS